MSYSWLRGIISLVLYPVIAGCTYNTGWVPDLEHIYDSALPTADLELDIPGLGPCTDNPDRTLRLDSTQPVIILAHGCFASAGRFRLLSEVFAFHGQQSACFSYNDRDSLTHSATQLADALRELELQLKNRQLTVIGHSQGGLISRNALTMEREQPLESGYDLRLVTISSPFAGIAAADHCASSVARVISLGMVAPICKLISGDKWFEITSASDFIRIPGNLNAQVNDYLKIVTDERDSCRRYNSSGRCIEDDYVFSIEEQIHDAIDDSPEVIPVEVKAGHAEIVGNGYTTPAKLISILQQHGIMHQTSTANKDNFESLLDSLYLTN